MVPVAAGKGDLKSGEIKKDKEEMINFMGMVWAELPFKGQSS